MLALTLVAICASGREVPLTDATAVLATLTVLSHNVTVAVFALAFLAAGCAYVVGRAPRYLVVRTAVAAAISVLLYFFFIRPLVSGWHSTGNPTPVLVSFAAHAGVPSLALAGLGIWLAIIRKERGVSMAWPALMLCGSICFLQVTGMTWNPRYFLFFMPALWILAAYAMERVAQRFEYRSAAAAWYGCVVVLLLPNLLSHYQDGSRHDYRRAAEVAGDLGAELGERLAQRQPATLRRRRLGGHRRQVGLRLRDAGVSCAGRDRGARGGERWRALRGPRGE